MEHTQLPAGFFLDSAKEFLIAAMPEKSKELESLLHGLCYFDLSIDAPPSRSDIGAERPLLEVADNLVSRGLPTRCQLAAEESIINAASAHGVAFSKDAEAAQIGTIRYIMKADDSFAETLFKALHIVDPRLSPLDVFEGIKRGQPYAFDSLEEQAFLREGFAASMPESWLQLIACQRPIDSILKKNAPDNCKPSSADFAEQRTDFSLELPYETDGIKGLVFEVDGSQHAEEAAAYLDAKRDEALESCLFRTFRIPAQDAAAPQQVIDSHTVEQLSQSGYLQIIQENYEQPLWYSEEGKAALYIALAPYLCARIQKTILHLIMNGHLPLDAPAWKIAFINDFSLARA